MEIKITITQENWEDMKTYQLNLNELVRAGEKVLVVGADGVERCVDFDGGRLVVRDPSPKDERGRLEKLADFAATEVARVAGDHTLLLQLQELRRRLRDALTAVMKDPDHREDPLFVRLKRVRDELEELFIRRR